MSIGYDPDHANDTRDNNDDYPGGIGARHNNDNDNDHHSSFDNFFGRVVDKAIYYGEGCLQGAIGGGVAAAIKYIPLTPSQKLVSGCVLGAGDRIGGDVIKVVKEVVVPAVERKVKDYFNPPHKQEIVEHTHADDLYAAFLDTASHGIEAHRSTVTDQRSAVAYGNELYAAYLATSPETPYTQEQVMMDISNHFNHGGLQLHVMPAHDWDLMA